MAKKANPIHDLHGAGKLTVDAIKGIVDLVESVHYSILNLGGILGNNPEKKTKGIAGLVYKNIRTTSALVGKGLNVLAEKLVPVVEEKESTPGREAALAVLNGVLGDYLEETKNPLAIPMHLRIDRKSIINFNEPLFQELIRRFQGKIVLLIHGSCMNDLQWGRNGHDHGKAIEQDLGYLPLYLHYNSGRHISQNGKDFAKLMEALNSQMGDKLTFNIIAHSMGGLVARSAVYYAKTEKQGWVGNLEKMIFLGTPHHGSPLERAGNWIDNVLEKNPYSKPFSRLGKIRSAGVTDLRYGNVVDEDWQGRDRFESAGDLRVPVPLPADVACFTIAATTDLVSDRLAANLIGDGLVPLNSALGKHKNPDLNLSFPESHQWIGRKMSHLDLLNHPYVYNVIKNWISEA